MTTTQIGGSNFKEKRKDYEKKLLNLSKESGAGLTELNIKKEKLEKGKEILDIIAGLFDKRTEKANSISKMITAGKDLNEVKSQLESVNDINKEINKARETLKSIEINNESISGRIANILGEDISKETISETINNFDEELEKTNNKITETEENSKKQNILKEKYEKYISYIDKYLDGSKEIDISNKSSLLETDIVYQDAIKEGKENIIQKMKNRTLTISEYENILTEINPSYGYLVHQINISNSDSDKIKYLELLDKLEQGEISEEERKDLNNNTTTRLNKRDELEGDKENNKSEQQETKDENKEETKEQKYNLDELIASIPVYKKDNPSKNAVNAKTVISNFEKLDNDNDKEAYIQEMKNKGWKMLIERNPIIKKYLNRELNSQIEKELDGVFKTKEEYETFKKDCYHNEEFAEKLLKEGKINFLDGHLMYFKKLSTKYLKKLISNGVNINKIVENRRSFETNINEFLIILLKSDLPINQITRHLIKGTELNNELAKEIINGGYNTELQKFLEEGWFEKLDSGNTKLLANTDLDRKIFIAKNPNLFDIQSIDNNKLADEIMDSLINQGRYEEVIEIFKNIDFDNKQKYAELMLDNEDQKDGNNRYSLLASNIDKIKGLDHNILAGKIFNKDQYSLTLNLGKFSDLNMSIVDKLIESGFDETLADKLGSFDGSLRIKIIIKLLKTWDKKQNINLLKNISLIRRSIDDNELIKLLLSNITDFPNFLKRHIKSLKFRNLHFEIAEKIFEETKDLKFLAENINCFERKQQKKIIDLLLEEGECESLAENINKLESNNEKERIAIAMKLIEKDKLDIVAKNISKFELDSENQGIIVGEFIKKDGLNYVYENLDNFNTLSEETKLKIKKSVLGGIDMYIDDSGIGTLKGELRTDFGNFDKRDIREYISNPNAKINLIFFHIPLIREEYRTEVILQLMERNIITLKKYINEIPYDRWIKYFNCLNQEIVDAIEKKGKEGDNGWGFIIGCLEKFNVENKEELFDKAIKMVNKSYLKYEIRVKLDSYIKGLGTDLTAKLLLKHGYGLYIAKYIDKFDEKKHEKLLKILMKHGHDNDILRYIHSFKGVDTQDITEKIREKEEKEGRENKDLEKNLKKRRFDEVLEKIKKDEPLDFRGKTLRGLRFTREQYKKIGEELIKQGNYDYLADNMDAFNNVLDQKIALELIEKGKEACVANYPKAFIGKISEEITAILLDKGLAKTIFRNAEYFKGLNYEVAEILLKRHSYEEIIENIDNFDPSTHQKIAENFIGTEGLARRMAENLTNYFLKHYQNFKNLNDKKIVEKILKTRAFDALAENINQFKTIDKYEIAEKIIEKKGYDSVFKYLGNFRSEDPKNHKMVTDLLSDEQYAYFADKLTEYKNLDNVIALKLITIGKSKQVAEHPKSFKEKFSEKITKILIDEGHSKLLAENFKYFKGLDYYIATKVDYKGEISAFIENFRPEDHEKIAQYLIDNERGISVASNFEKFKLLNKNNIAKQLIEKGYGSWMVVYNEGKFKKGKTIFAEKLRSFFKEQEKITPTIFIKNKEELKENFEKYCGILQFPNSWRNLIAILGGKPGCNTVGYFKALLKSKDEGDNYYRNYIKERTSKELVEVLSSTGEEELTEKEEGKEVKELSQVEKIKAELLNWNVDEKLINLIDEDNQGTINYEDIERVLEENKNNIAYRDLDIDYICEIMEIAGVEIQGEEQEEPEEEPIEFSNDNLGEIQRRLKLNGKAWNTLKKLVNENGEITAESFTGWMDTNQGVLTNFLHKLSNVGIKIVENNEIKKLNDKPEDFVSEFEGLGFNCKNRKAFIENLELAFIADPDMKDQLNDVLKKMKEYSKNPKDMKDPIKYVETHNKNKNFFVIKFRTAINAPRIIIDPDRKTLLTIVNHETYDGIRGKHGSKYFVLLKGVENKKFW